MGADAPSDRHDRPLGGRRAPRQPGRPPRGRRRRPGRRRAGPQLRSGRQPPGPQGRGAGGGGFAANTDMIGRYAPAVAGQMLLGTDGDDGTSIRLGQGLGAAVAHMEAAEAALPSNPPLVYPSLLVNRFGQRFINEDTYCGRIGQMAVFHQQARCSLILDEEIFESVPEGERWGARPTHVAATVAELEAEMGLPDGSLQATVDQYNRHA